jgi:hypothetical protein
MMFTKVQRNQIYQLILESNLNPGECELTITDDRTRVSHGSGSYFEISARMGTSDVIPKYYDAQFVVVDGNTWGYHDQIGFGNVMPGISAWAQEVKLVTETRDYWTEMARGRELLTRIERIDSGNTIFTQDEQRQIAAHLQEVKKLVRTQFELSSEQIAQIDEKLDEVIEASKHMGRKDWLVMVGGIIFTLIITATVSAGLGEHIFIMVIQGLAHLFTGGNEPPQILA